MNYGSTNDIQQKKKLSTLQSLRIICKIGLSPSLRALKNIYLKSKACHHRRKHLYAPVIIRNTPPGVVHCPFSNLQLNAALLHRRCTCRIIVNNMLNLLVFLKKTSFASCQNKCSLTFPSISKKTRTLCLCKINMAVSVFRSSSVMCGPFILSLYLAQVAQASVAG